MQSMHVLMMLMMLMMQDWGKDLGRIIIMRDSCGQGRKLSKVTHGPSTRSGVSSGNTVIK